MVLKINVTWPERLPQVRIPTDCRRMVPISEKATKDEGAVHITIDGAFDAGNRVCDDDRYRIRRDIARPLECCGPCADFDQTLVILLESPHEQEYAAGCIDRPIAPALGMSGKNIRDCLMSVIGNCNHLYDLLGRNVRVIIANPIQFQCSLMSTIEYRSVRGKRNWRKVRDLVWKALWSRQAIQRDCRDRLIEYSPDFIINACTHDERCNSRWKVQRTPHDRRSLNDCTLGCRKRKVHLLLRNFSSAHIYEANHPYRWHTEGARTLELVQEASSGNGREEGTDRSCDLSQ